MGDLKNTIKSPDPPLPQAGHMPSSVTEVVWCLTGMPGHRPRSTGELSISQGTNSFWGFIWFYVQNIKHSSKNAWYCAVILLKNATWSHLTCPTYYVTCLVPALYSCHASVKAPVLYVNGYVVANVNHVDLYRWENMSYNTLKALYL